VERRLEKSGYGEGNRIREHGHIVAVAPPSDASEEGAFFTLRKPKTQRENESKEVIDSEVQDQ
jgi:hypothetical protein